MRGEIKDKLVIMKLGVEGEVKLGENKFIRIRDKWEGN